ncbi:MAG TPA: DUF302 domain-containing protein, partial [Candidatus Kaiserbacteria bacterium]|nr:DUF302 domain-containing protein [Candidatus Kaiserbacteria bacterium]
MNYYHTKKTALPFDQAVTKTKEELSKEGFGILTEIDVKDVMKKKIGAEYENYVILGACNPNFAHPALQISKEIGLLLPCNVLVYEESGEVYVSTIMPTVAMSVADVDGLSEIAQ